MPQELRRRLLADKITVRPPRPGVVSRRSVITRARGTDARVVGVTAPAGYGKSTLLAEWASLEDRAVAWASLDRFDVAPAALLTLLARATSQVCPDSEKVVADMHGTSSSMLGRSAPMLATVLSRPPRPFVLFVDDVHLAASPACQDVLEVVLAGIPEDSQVVLASRHQQPHLARTRVDGRTHEIGRDELRMDLDEARRLFAAADVRLSEAEIATSVTRAEGWPTGLSLIALSVGAGGEAAAGGEGRFVADYLYRECLRRQPEHVQRFLRRTAVLDHLSGPVCDAVLERHDGRVTLREVEARGLFLVPVDATQGSYRYHALFREFLLGELERTEPGLIGGLHRRAADWHHRQGHLDPAIQHLVAGDDLTRAAELVAGHSVPTYQRGQIDVVERWLGELGQRIVDASPELAVIATWVALLQGRALDAERMATVVETLPPPEAGEEQLVFESARAMLRSAMCREGPEQALLDARFAVEHEPEWSPWRDQALHLLGAALLLVGDRDGAHDAFVQAALVAHEAGNPESVMLSEAELAIMAADEGSWESATAHVGVALRVIDDHHLEGYPTASLALAAGARLAVRRGDPQVTERLVTRATRARAHSTHLVPYLAVRTRQQLAEVYAARGDRAAARHMISEIDTLLLRRPRLGVLVEELHRLREQLRHQAAGAVSVPLTPAELRLLPYLQTHLTIAEIGERLCVSRNTVSTQVGSIYRKLEVTTRSAAVDRAVEVGLLGA
ncbi:LuxR C-terminal-related transcriptional regulator [Janibacter alkaliphilus]